MGSNTTKDKKIRIFVKWLFFSFTHFIFDIYPINYKTRTVVQILYTCGTLAKELSIDRFGACASIIPSSVCVSSINQYPVDSVARPMLLRSNCRQVCKCGKFYCPPSPRLCRCVAVHLGEML